MTALKLVDLDSAPSTLEDQPHSIEAEQTILGSVLSRNHLYDQLCDKLEPKHFYEPLHQQIWGIFARLSEEGRAINPVVMKPSLPELSNMSSDDAFAYLMKLVEAALPDAHAAQLAQVVIENYARRRLQDVGHLLQGSSKDLAKGIKEIVSDQMSILSEIEDEADIGKEVQFGAVLGDALDQLQVDAQDDRRIGWFLPEIERVCGKLRPGNLVGLLSDSGGGKTSAALQQSDYVAGEENVPTCFISLEITRGEAALQLIAQRSRIQMDDLDLLNLSEAQEETVYITEHGRAKDIPLYIEEIDAANTAKIRNKVQSMKRKYGCRFFVIDHAKFIELPGRGSDVFAERVNTLYSRLKGICKDFEVTILLLIQRNDAWKRRKNPTPIDGDCYGGGSVKQAMDVLLALYRPEPLYEDKLSVEESPKERERIVRFLEGTADREGVRGIAKFINMKRRRGKPKQEERVKFVAEFTRFESIEEQTEDLGL